MPTYDEIVRSTVPDPDSSQRPTSEQEKLAREGYRHLDPDEHALYVRVVAALEDALRESHRSWSFTIEVDREHVAVRGRIPDAVTLALVENTVRGVAGVGAVDNRLVIEP